MMSEVKLELANVIGKCQKSHFNPILLIKKKILFMRLEKLRSQL